MNFWHGYWMNEWMKILKSTALKCKFILLYNEQISANRILSWDQAVTQILTAGNLWGIGEKDSKGMTPARTTQGWDETQDI